MSIKVLWLLSHNWQVDLVNFILLNTYVWLLCFYRLEDINVLAILPKVNQLLNKMVLTLEHEVSCCHSPVLIFPPFFHYMTKRYLLLLFLWPLNCLHFFLFAICRGTLYIHTYYYFELEFYDCYCSVLFIFPVYCWFTFSYLCDM